MSTRIIRRILPGPLVVAAKRLVSGFLFLPTLIALLDVALAFLMVWIDRSCAARSFETWISVLTINATGARSVLATIAGATMTVISLVYSLTLVVFTLVAANTGPRRLENFTNNRVNQVTIGLLAATFLYALIALYIVGENEVPKLSVAFGIMMVTFSLFTLIYFVNDAARSVKVDSEIARTQRALRRSVERLLTYAPAEHGDDRDQIPCGQIRTVRARWPGYVNAVDVDELKRLTIAGQGFINMTARLGDYLVKGEPLCELIDCSDDCDLEAVHLAIMLDSTRMLDGDIKFNLHLGVEIALRALSPGVNDSYTALGVIDHISGSLAMILQRGVPSALNCDDDGTPRVWMEIIGIKDIIGVALHPLRRSSRGNLLVTLRLIQAIGSLRAVSPNRHVAILNDHLRLVASDAKHSVQNKDSRKEVAECLRMARRDLGEENTATPKRNAGNDS